MKKYSLLTYLFLGLFVSISVLFVFAYIVISNFESSLSANLIKQCEINSCNESFTKIITEQNLINSTLNAELITYAPWLFLFLIILTTSVYFLYREISLPLQEMQHRMLKFSRGIFKSSVPDYKIKELSRFAQTTNNLGLKLENLELIRKDFVANVSHELKTPITSIKGFVETIIDGNIDNTEESKRFLTIIKDQANRMSSVIEDLILISKLENESTILSLSKENKSLEDILKVVKNQLQNKAGDKKINLNLECPNTIELDCSPTLLEQAVFNLVDNGIKYCNEGSTINLTATNGSGTVKIKVKDDGPGIAQNHLPRIFERFYRVDKARSRVSGGSGLGLSITKHIVTAHGGKINVKSEKGIGTEFTIELPKVA